MTTVADEPINEAAGPFLRNRNINNSSPHVDITRHKVESRSEGVFDDDEDDEEPKPYYSNSYNNNNNNTMNSINANTGRKDWSTNNTSGQLRYQRSVGMRKSGSGARLSPSRPSFNNNKNGNGHYDDSDIRSGMTSSSSTETESTLHHGANGGKDANGSVTMLVDEPGNKKWRNWWVRTFWTFMMIAGFFAILASGHIWVVLLVVVIQTMVYWEVISIAHVPSKAKKMPWFRTFTWYFLLSTNYFMYGETIITYFKESVFVDAFLTPLATHHSFISFSLYVIGFVGFVSNLQKGHYKFQFTQFAWTHMTLLLVIVQSQFIVKNIFEGLVWFVLPTSLVICNDITAYITGFFFGRTPLIRLSPKKTWEGFIGALIATTVFAFFFARAINFPYMTCPVRNMKTGSSECEVNPVFLPMDVDLWPSVRALIWHITGWEIYHVSITPFQLHAVVMALFASLIAPFGGFFASGAKRAFKLKDFGDYIPGHGGITDRMDCQFLMSFFAFLYYQSFIAQADLTVGQVLQLIAGGLAPQDQLDLFFSLRESLIQQGVLDKNGINSMPALSHI
ncbi:hypothetical protein HDU76_013505 [Blyttiomyces sp. JEL0837]|nr:hypothetical protein HDU76_013505 [Blyttiomyces sp. JEL0837]